MSSNYSSTAFKTSSQDKNQDDLPMLGLDTDAPEYSNLNISPALNSFKSPVGGALTCDPLALRKNLSYDDVQQGVDENNYIDINVEMYEDIESGEENASARKSSSSLSIATEDRSDYDPTEPSDWESDEPMEEANKPEKEQFDLSAGACLHVKVRQSWPVRFAKVVEELESEEESDPSMIEEQSDSSEDSDFGSSSADDSDDSGESDEESTGSNSSYWWSESSEDDQLITHKRAMTALFPLEDTIDIENPYYLHLQDQRYMQDEIFLFWYLEVDIETHRRRMAGRMVRSTFYKGELRIIRPTLWVIDMHDEGRSNLVGSFKIWGIIIFVWLSHRFNRKH